LFVSEDVSVPKIFNDNSSPLSVLEPPVMATNYHLLMSSAERLRRVFNEDDK
jgi:hypothetical protein